MTASSCGFSFRQASACSNSAAAAGICWRRWSVDFSPKTIAKAKSLYPHLNFVLGDVEDQATLAAIEGPFDYIVLADTIGLLEDIDGTLRLIHRFCAPSTRLIIAY